MAKGSLLSGVGLIIAGGIFIAAANSSGRSSKLGLIVGGLIILLGIGRIVQANRQTPPSV
jgi:hypothetical protein